MEYLAELIGSILSYALERILSAILTYVFLHPNPFGMDAEPDHFGFDRKLHGPRIPLTHPEKWRIKRIRRRAGIWLNDLLVGVVWHSTHIALEWGVYLPCRIIDLVVRQLALGILAAIRFLRHELRQVGRSLRNRDVRRFVLRARLALAQLHRVLTTPLPVVRFEVIDAL